MTWSDLLAPAIRYAEEGFAVGKFRHKVYKKYAASGAWISEDKYQVRAYLYETPARITYTFTFSDDGLVWVLVNPH